MSVKASVASIALSGCPEAGAIRCRPEVAGRMSDAPQLQKLEEIVERAEGASLIELETVDGWKYTTQTNMSHSTLDGIKTIKQYGVRPTDESTPGMWGTVSKPGAVVGAYWWKIQNDTTDRTGNTIRHTHAYNLKDVEGSLQFKGKPVKMNEETVPTQTVFGNDEHGNPIHGLSVDVQAMAAVQRGLTHGFEKVFFAFRRWEKESEVSKAVIEAYMIEVPQVNLQNVENLKMVKVNYNPDTNKFSEL